LRTRLSASPPITIAEVGVNRFMGHGPILVPDGGTISVPSPLCGSTDRYHPQKGDADRLAAAHTDSTH
jgi:hypothetical protein